MRLPINTRSNPNLLYADFRNVESFSDDYNNPLTNRKSPFAKKDDIYLAQLINSSRSTHSPPDEQEFGELPLEQQIDALLCDSSKKHIDANELHKLLTDQAQTERAKRNQSRAHHNATPSQFLSNTILAADLTLQTASIDQPSKTPKYKIALPPLNVHDPFNSNSSVKHWTFRQPVKHSQTSRTASVNASIVSETYRKNYMETPRERSILGTKHIKSQSALKLPPHSLDTTVFKLGRVSNKHLSASVRGLPKKRKDLEPLVLLEDPSKNRNSLYDSMTESIKQQLKDPHLLASGGIIVSKNLNKLQTASREAKFLLKTGLEEGAGEHELDLKLLERSQARSQTIFTDADKRIVGMPVSNKHVPTSTRNLDTLTNEMMDEKLEMTNFSKNYNTTTSPRGFKRMEQQNMMKKKEFYNKWYMPVKFWGIEKDEGARGKKYTALKKDINYFYNNMNNFGSQLPRSPSKGSSNENPQQAFYEEMQDKLRQNIVLKKYKKELLDNHQRVPNCLSAIEEDLKN